MDRASFRQQYPEMWEQREQDKLEFRFPGTGGESYQDVIQRVRPIIVELERQVLDRNKVVRFRGKDEICFCRWGIAMGYHEQL